VERAETIKLFGVFKTAYPKYFISQDKAELQLQITLWTELFSDIPFCVVEPAVKKLILESAYPPTISDVRKQVAEITQDPGDRADVATAWGEVMRAISLYGYYRPQEALASMSPRTAKIVGFIGWEEICTSGEIGVARGQFVKMYDAYAQRERQDALLPAELKQKIQRIGSDRKSLKLIGGSGG
jgi:hypothetical protein